MPCDRHGSDFQCSRRLARQMKNREPSMVIGPYFIPTLCFGKTILILHRYASGR